MRRADRLFQIIQLLRAGSTVTAGELARELEVSERTVYRDVRDLMASGVPIEGEAGVGYVLQRGFDLPPLMFTESEVEALVVGARMVEAWGDEDLARQARNVVRKAENVLPEPLRDRARSVQIFAPTFHVRPQMTDNMESLRRAVAARRKVRFGYRDRVGGSSERLVRPLGLFFWGASWTLVGWCELRADFRTFRPDRMRELAVTDDAVPDEAGRDLAAFLARVDGESERPCP